MVTFPASEAGVPLDHLIDEIAANHAAVRITGKRNSAVLVAESDWNAIQETLRLLALPGMRESIREGLATPLYKCDTKLEW